MKKIMFNDALGLTQAVLECRKTQTRREIKCPRTRYGIEVAGFEVHKFSTGFCEVVTLDYDGREIGALEPKYGVGEVVAIAQSYESIFQEALSTEISEELVTQEFFRTHSRAGWKNKMFVKADFMRHHIRITNIRVERLQDISAEDCKCEGIYKWSEGWSYEEDSAPFSRTFRTPYEAFRALIGKLDRKMWERNPFVFVYEFELMD